MYKIVDIMHNIIYTKDSDFYIITIFSIERNDIIMPSLRTALNELYNALTGNSEDLVKTKFTNVSEIISSSYGDNPSRETVDKMGALNMYIRTIIWQKDCENRNNGISLIINFIDQNKKHYHGVQAEVKNFLQKIKDNNLDYNWENISLTSVFPDGRRTYPIQISLP